MKNLKQGKIQEKIHTKAETEKGVLNVNKKKKLPTIRNTYPH